MSDSALTRKSFFVDPRALQRARKALGVSTNAEAIRAALQQVVDMHEYWAFMDKSRGKLTKGSIESP